MAAAPSEARSGLPPAADRRAQRASAKSLVAGATGGAVEAACTYPFEFAKTRLQLARSRDGQTTSRNPVVLLRTVARTEGVAAIYEGCSTLVVGTAVKAAVRFFGFDTIRNALADDDGKLTPARSVLAGLGAGLLESVCAVTPFETVKTALIDDAKTRRPRYHGLVHGTAALIRENGFRGLFRGLMPVTLRQGANSAVRMSSYSTIRDYLLARSPDDQQQQQGKASLSTAATFGVGATAGAITVYTTMPLDTVKTRMQSLDAKSEYRNTWHCVVRVFREEGVLAFWRGATPRLGRLILSGGIVFSVYEKMMMVL